MARMAKYKTPKKTSLILEGHCLEWLQRQAEHHRSSVSAEVNRLVDQAIAAQGAPSGNIEDQIRALIESDRVPAARALLAAQPDNPRLANLRRVLSPAVATSVNLPGVDRSLDYRWLEEHAHGYRGRWVAVERGHLLAHSDDLQELLDLVGKSSPTSRALIHRVSD